MDRIYIISRLFKIELNNYPTRNQRDPGVQSNKTNPIKKDKL